MTHPTPPPGTGIAGAMDYRPASDHAGPVCFVCGSDIDGASYAARAVHGYGVAQVCSVVCRDDPAFAGARVDGSQIEVTEEMIAACVDAYVDFNMMESDTYEDLVTAIFRAMMAATNKKAPAETGATSPTNQPTPTTEPPAPQS